MTNPIKLTAGERATLAFLRDQEDAGCVAPAWKVAGALKLSPRGVSRIFDRLQRRNLVGFATGGIGRALTRAGALAIGRPF